MIKNELDKVKILKEHGILDDSNNLTSKGIDLLISAVLIAAIETFTIATNIIKNKEEEQA